MSPGLRASSALLNDLSAASDERSAVLGRWAMLSSDALVKQQGRVSYRSHRNGEKASSRDWEFVLETVELSLKAYPACLLMLTRR